MSRSNFYRKIKALSGMSPNDYLKTLRMNRAAEPVSYTHLDVYKRQEQEKEKRTLVTNLQKKQKGLQNEINKKRREANQLNARIDKLIAEEIERARKRAQEEARREAAARKKEESKEGKSAATETAAKSKPLEAYTMSKADRELSGNFAANRGKLPMPISGAYIITSRYGQYAVDPNIIIRITSSR